MKLYTRPEPRWATTTNLAAAKRDAAAAAGVPSKALVPTQRRLLDIGKREIVWRPSADLERKAAMRELAKARRLPLVWTGVTGVTGAVGWGWCALMDWTVTAAAASNSALVFGGATAAGSGIAGAVVAAKHAKERRKAADLAEAAGELEPEPEQRERVRARIARWLAGAGASTAWVTTSALLGITWWQLALGAGAAAVTSLGHMRDVSIRQAALDNAPAHEPEPEQVPAGPDPLDVYRTRWYLFVAGKGGVLPESELMGLRNTEHGVQAIVRLNPAVHTAAAVQDNVPRIRAGLGLTRSDVVVVDEPDEVDGIPLTADMVRLQIVTRSPVVKAAPWFTAPRFLEPGLLAVGRYVDGDGEAGLRLWNDDGVWSVVLIGGTGGGKSALLDAIAVSARSQGFVIGYADPQGGASSPDLAAGADWRALGRDRMVALIEALEQIGRDREAWVNAHDVGGVLVPGRPAPCKLPQCPCGGRVPPPMLVIIDECHDVFGCEHDGSPLAARFAALVKQWRKLGVGFVVATQETGLKAFGNDDSLRSNLATKNLLAFHVKSNTGGKLIPGMPIDPKLLPPVPGFAALSSEDSRRAELRTYWLPRRAKDGAGRAADAPLFAEDAFSQYPPTPMHPMDFGAIQHYLPQTEGVTATIDPGFARRLEATMAGRWQPRQLTSTTPGSTVRRGIPTAPGSSTSSAPTTRPPVGGVPRIPAAPVTDLADRRPALDRAGLNEAEHRVLAAIAAGAYRTGDVVDYVGGEQYRDQVNRALRTLRDKGWTTQTRRGVHELTVSGRAGVAS